MSSVGGEICMTECLTLQVALVAIMTWLRPDLSLNATHLGFVQYRTYVNMNSSHLSS